MQDINSQANPQGFGSYLTGILPQDVAVAAGSFSASVMQIKNIKNTTIEKVSVVVANLETTKNLNINGSNIPVDIGLANLGLNKLALGDGPYKTYTMSNFFGAMSGLPYNGPFKIIQETLKELQTPWLLRTYQQLYLAVTWKQATATVQYVQYNVMTQSYNSITGQPRVDNWYYKITGITVTDQGGGYGRERTAYTGPYSTSGSYSTEPNLNPAVTITGSSGATASSQIDFTDTNVPGNFGKVISITLTSLGSPVLYSTTSVMSDSAPPTPTLSSPPECLIQAPPITIVYPYSYAEYQASGTTGWPVMNNVINDYIDRANKEIISIAQNNVDKIKKLNDAYDSIGSALNYEQQSRYTGLQRLPYISSTAFRDSEYSQYPVNIMTFIDSMNNYMNDTKPHMYAQTLEAISNTNSTGGQSIIGVGRELRNQSRLNYIGVPLDNNIPDTLNQAELSELIYNGKLPLDEVATTPISTLIVNDSVIEPPIVAEPVPTAKTENDGNLDQNPYIKIFPPPNLNTEYTQNTLSSGVYNVQEAIDNVILCNCDCWNNL